MQFLTSFQLLERINALLSSEARKRYAALGIQPVHVQVLEYLSLCNHYSDTPAALTEYLGLTKGTVSQSLQILERKGYISKTQDMHDGRVVHLQLLDAGLDILHKVQPLDIFTEAEETLLHREFRSVRHALGATLQVLQQANNSKSFGLCNTCKHFTEIDGHTHCGLTDEPLHREVIQKICREHEFR
ncbi:MAG: MarR family winged helix-turn-helix transcriptional regulator [Methylococcales bacterium]|nr:MarR family winged helix-turn-helix transcriptional regulator [Methylococcales bacterium]